MFNSLSAIGFKPLKYQGKLCESEAWDIQCEGDRFIHVVGINYGRTEGDSHCLPFIDNNSTIIEECHTNAINITTLVKEDCDGKTECSLDISRLAEHAKHCPNNSYPYLDLHYECVVKTKTRYICKTEGPMSIICPSDHLIMIRNAVFGQIAGEDRCSSLEAPKANCSSLNTLKYVYYQCQKTSNCEISWEANDPCPIDNDLNSFLEVEYACLKCKNEKPNRKCNHLAKIGHCHKNPGWMYTYCRKSCWKCRTIRDIEQCKNTAIADNQCEQWVREGKCYSDRKHMLLFCLKSCRKCREPKGIPTCVNNLLDDALCERLAYYGFCQYNHDSMNDLCFKTCSGCEFIDSKGDICDNPSGDENCNKWASTNECDLNRDWMSQQCTRACKRCNEVKRTKEELPKIDCFNSFGDETCRKWGTDIHCHINPQWMLHICYKTCSKCDEKAEPKCVNLIGDDSICLRWGISGLCVKRRNFMEQYCYKMCTHCKPIKEKPIDCSSIRKECADWIKINGCSKKKGSMSILCFKECEACQLNIDNTITLR
ncbi:DgyrCDS10778 [Dimorphilus gyrociliatus]|uniref:DgyrCDS10778 n=1 Tax=Dimorphilus gyrociliatus TaxID=2664684 RepID=A0A7I8W6B3_9ANNE|nr:DgyrCDS10778 [Dimorphilus gyrociliatus]